MQLKKIKNILTLGLTLAKANFKLRNEGSYLGIFWYLLEPLCFFGIILLVGGVINQNPVKFYPLYLFLGLIMFNFFTNATSAALRAVSGNAGLIKSIKLDHEALVMSGVFQFVFSHLIEVFIFLLFMAYFGADFWWLFLYAPILVLFLIFISGFSFILAMLGVYIADFSNIWSVFTRLLWFLTPIFYTMPPSALFQKISYINPMFHFINISRQVIIYHQSPGYFALFFMVFFSFFSLAAGLWLFNKYKAKFAENA